MTQSDPAATESRTARFSRRGLFVFRAIASLGILALMVHTLANVVGRYFFNQPLSGTIEMVSYWYMPIVAFLGFVLAKHAGEMIEAPLIFDNLTWGNRRILVLIASAIGVVMCALWAYYGLQGAIHAFEIKLQGGVSTIPVWPVHFLPPIIFAILAVMFGLEGVRALRGRIDTKHDLDEVALGSLADTDAAADAEIVEEQR